MAIAWLAAVTIWTFFVLRTLGARTVLSTSTVVLYSLLGALWGPFILWLARSFVPNPTWYGALSVVLLWIPVGATLLLRNAWQSHTVADGFVLGFAVGFGYDATLEMIGIAFRDVARDGLPSLLSFVPPTALQGDWLGWDHAMNGYWLALPTLALVAGLRFLRSRVAAVVLAMMCFAFSAVERVGWVGVTALGFSEDTANMISIARQNGRLFPWIALVALLTLSALEAWWVARACPTRGKIIELMRDWQASVMAFTDRDWRKFAGVNSLSRVRRQTQLLRAELTHSPKNSRLKKALDASERRLMLHPDPNNMPVGPFSFRTIYLGLATLALLTTGLIFLVPYLPDSVSDRFWVTFIQLPTLFTTPVDGPFVTNAAAILLALAAWFYISAGTLRKMGDTNALTRSRGESWIKVICLVLFSLLFVSGIAPELNYFSNSILYDLNLDYYGNFGLARLYTYIPFLMAVALAATLPQDTLSRSEDVRGRRDTLQRRVLTLIGVFVAITLLWVLGIDLWISNFVFSAAGGEWAPEAARVWASWQGALAKVLIVWGTAFAVRALTVPTLKLVRLWPQQRTP